jgi:hypothetical protein
MPVGWRRVARQQQRHTHQRQASGAGGVPRERGVELALGETQAGLGLCLVDDRERDRSDAVGGEPRAPAGIELGVRAQEGVSPLGLVQRGAQAIR